MILPLLLLAQADPAAAPAAAPKPEKQQCRRFQASTGSIMPAKAVCHTKSEWAAIDASHAKDGDALSGAGARDTMRGSGH